MTKMNSAPLAVRVAGNGFSFSVRRLWQDVLARRLHQRALVELESLPAHVKHDIGWPERANGKLLTHDKR